MPGIRFERHVETFMTHVEMEATAYEMGPTSGSRPASITVVEGGRSKSCLLYLWTVTPGGKNRPLNEWRIQLTNTPGSLRLRPGVRTIVGGWNVECGVWAFWDARRHTRFSRKSPSFQITWETLDAAGQSGIASQVRPTDGGREAVVALRPEHLAWYVFDGASLHDMEDEAASVTDLAHADVDEERAFLDAAGSEDSTVRRFDLVEIMRAYRNRKFQPEVLRAYGYRCAICACDLKLTDAAHIVPVVDPRSTDDVRNGMALCRLHHGAFDNCLLGVRPDYRVIVNPDAERRLVRIGQASALPDFRARLPETIRLPNVHDVRPDPKLLKLGMEVRRWPPQLIAGVLTEPA